MMRLNSAASVVLLTERAVTCQLLATAASMMACSIEKPRERDTGRMREWQRGLDTIGLAHSNNYAKIKWLLIYSREVFTWIQRLKAISLQSKIAFQSLQACWNIVESLDFVCEFTFACWEANIIMKWKEELYLHIIKRSVVMLLRLAQLNYGI